jgi:xanthine/CO dehydrogenase XdhC/CoxF family maturation factor
MTGAISGGCLEGDALRKALLALDQNRSKLITYDTSDEDDAVIGAQLGCNGIIQVLFEPIDPEKQNNPIELLRKAEHADQPVALVSLFNLDKTKHQAGIVLLVDEQSNITGQIDDQALCEKITSVARNSLKKRINHFGEYRSAKDTQHAFVEFITPPPRLVLVGAGNDAQFLSLMAKPLGWAIIVADGRPTHANNKRFNSCQVIVTNPGELLDNIEIHEQTAFVLITHNYNYDLDVLKLLLNEEKIPYIGILGPNKKYRRMLDDLQEDGITLSKEQSSKIFAPVGLQLGAETPAEIGLSILSEIQGVLTDSDIRSLRELEGSIHNKENREFREIPL